MIHDAEEAHIFSSIDKLACYRIDPLVKVGEGYGGDFSVQILGGRHGSRDKDSAMKTSLFKKSPDLE